MIRTVLIVFLAFGVSISLSSIEHKTQDRECEIFNSTNCAKDSGDCEMKRGFCKDVDADKPSNCFVLWSTDNQTNEVKVSMKGCFTYNHACKDDQCVDTSYELNKGLNFCCCSGNMCNQDHKWVKPAVKPTEVPEESSEPNPKKHEIWMIVTLTIAVCLFVCSAAYVGYQFYLKRSKQAMFNELPTKEPELSVSLQCLDLRPIQLLEIKARGRFGTVWKGLMKNEELAVKIFPCQDKDSWVTEHEIYKLARMNHPNILHFIGAEKHVDPTTDFWLITEYHAHGSLCDYLKANTVTWPELCKIAESMARGLQHLHEEIPASKTDGIKPAVAHRDFKSKNVLLKKDLTACIADFGLALVFAPGKPCGDTHGQVGTRRYMAPEILEGAINFTRDSFLRIDVYACGLVLWELVTRCTGHGGPVTEFSLPFEAELGSHPTLEEMQENIVTKKMRPQIYEAWRTHLGLNAICDTIEECWDHDAEARLSSSCIMERVSQHTKYQVAHPVDTTTNNLLINNTDSI